VENVPWPLVALLVSVVLTAVIGIYAWIAGIRSGLDARLGKNEQTIAVIAERVEHLPTSREVTEMTAAIQRLTVEMAGVIKSLDGLAHRLDLHEEWFQRGAAS
jgi:hypothetical protein